MSPIKVWFEGTAHSLVSWARCVGDLVHASEAAGMVVVGLAGLMMDRRPGRQAGLVVLMAVLALLCATGAILGAWRLKNSQQGPAVEPAPPPPPTPQEGGAQ